MDNDNYYPRNEYVLNDEVVLEFHVTQNLEISICRRFTCWLQLSRSCALTCCLAHTTTVQLFYRCLAAWSLSSSPTSSLYSIVTIFPPQPDYRVQRRHTSYPLVLVSQNRYCTKGQKTYDLSWRNWPCTLESCYYYFLPAPSWSRIVLKSTAPQGSQILTFPNPNH